MAISFVNKGTFASGTTSCSPGIPASLAAGDLMLLFVETANQAVTQPSGWTEVTSSPIGTGTAAAIGAVRLTVYYRFWQSGDSAPSVAVTSGNHVTAIIAGYSGVSASTPFDGVTPVTSTAAASTTATMPGITTGSANAWVVHGIALDVDGNSTDRITGTPTNANLTGLTERHDQTVTTGVGGGVAIIDGVKASAGASGNTTATQASSANAYLTLSLRAQPATQTLTPGLYASSSSFPSPTVTPGGVTASQGGTLTNSQTFHAPTVTPGEVTLPPSLYSNSSTFHAPTVTPGEATLAPGLYTNAHTFHAPTVTPGSVTLTASLVSNSASFFAPSISQGGLPHRYWRLYVGKTYGHGDTNVAEIELRESLGGADVTGSGTPTASSTWGGLPVTNAFDNSGSTIWGSSGGGFGGHWVSYDFGAGNGKDIVEFTWQTRSDGFTSQAPLDLKLQWSDDNSTWTDKLKVESIVPWTAGQTRTFNANDYSTQNGDRTFWRLNITADNGSNAVSMAELQFRTSVGGANQATGGKGFVSVVYDSPVSAGNLFDGSTSTAWASSSASGIAGYRWASAKDIAEIAITSRPSFPTQAPKDFTVEYWNGSSFVTAMTVTGSSGWSSGETRSFILPTGLTQASTFTNTSSFFAPSISQSAPPHRYWRVYITMGTYGSTSYCGFSEIELRESLGGADVTGSGTASANSTELGNVAANAVDNNTSTQWYANSVMPCWWKYDFGAGNAKSIVEMAIDPAAIPYCPRDFQLQYSDDDSAWTTAFTVQNYTDWDATTNVFNADKRYDNAAAGEVWQVRMTAHGGSFTVALREIEMMLVSGGSDQCSGGYAFASSMNSYGQGAAGAFDNTINYWWANENNEFGGGSAWVGYRFPSATTVGVVALTSETAVYAPTAFTIERWNGSSWDVKYTASGITWTSDGQRKEFMVEGLIFPSLVSNSAAFHAATVSGGSGVILPPLVTSSGAFYGPTVGRGPVTLTQSSTYSNSAAFYGPTVTPAAVVLTPALYGGNAAAFFAPTVGRGPVDLAPSLYTGTSTFHAPTVSPGGVTLTPSLVTEGDALHAPTVTPGVVSLSPSLVSDADTFYSPSVFVGAYLIPSLLSDADSFYAATVGRGPVSLLPSLLTNSASFYAPALSGLATLTPGLVVDADSFYAATVGRGTVTLSPSLVSDGDTLLTPSVSASSTLAPALYAGSASFYAAAITTGGVTLTASLVSDSDTFYAATVASGVVGNATTSSASTAAASAALATVATTTTRSATSAATSAGVAASASVGTSSASTVSASMGGAVSVSVASSSAQTAAGALVLVSQGVGSTSSVSSVVAVASSDVAATASTRSAATAAAQAALASQAQVATATGSAASVSVSVASSASVSASSASAASAAASVGVGGAVATAGASSAAAQAGVAVDLSVATRSATRNSSVSLAEWVTQAATAQAQTASAQASVGITAVAATASASRTIASTGGIITALVETGSASYVSYARADVIQPMAVTGSSASGPVMAVADVYDTPGAYAIVGVVALYPALGASAQVQPAVADAAVRITAAVRGDADARAL